MTAVSKTENCLAMAHECMCRAQAEPLPEVRRKFLVSANQWIFLGTRALGLELKKQLAAQRQQELEGKVGPGELKHGWPTSSAFPISADPSIT